MGGSRKTNIDEGDCLKGRAWLVCRFKGVGVFKEGGGDPMHTMGWPWLPQEIRSTQNFC